ncbi:MAG: preprotein translocase subunit YajC [Clostridia bacterium]|nr:preprotein translocase subunit YajC [Clostridia bacterium]
MLLSLGSMIIPFALIFVVMYFFMIRPQKKKEKAVKAMLDALKTGDRIVTIGGIYGTVTSVREDQVKIAVGNQKTEMNMARWAIKTVEDAPLENDAEPEI